ncbi:hypothetical protein A5622_20285 [Mycobacterium sp. 1245801.1]|nr:hypothetical protein A5622_20285 [Mycobacterium sp. 1245801.1]
MQAAAIEVVGDVSSPLSGALVRPGRASLLSIQDLRACGQHPFRPGRPVMRPQPVIDLLNKRALVLTEHPRLLGCGHLNRGLTDLRGFRLLHGAALHMHTEMLRGDPATAELLNQPWH